MRQKGNWPAVVVTFHFLPNDLYCSIVKYLQSLHLFSTLILKQLVVSEVIQSVDVTSLYLLLSVGIPTFVYLLDCHV